MRFVRAYTIAATGELVGIMEQEIPFESVAIAVPQQPDALRMHELGLAEHFEAVDAETGAKVAPSAHIFQRATFDGTPVVARHGHELPAFHDIPTTKEGILSAVKAKGPSAIPERAAHWLEFMGVLEPHQMDAAGLPRLTLARALEFDAVRTARDPGLGSQAERLKREARARIADRETLRAQSSTSGARGVLLLYFQIAA